MPKFQTRRRVAFTPQQMYALVADVEKYPEFLPLCEALTVRKRQCIGGKEVMIADMHVGYGAIRERFTTRVTLDQDTPHVLAEYIDGPFSHMENRWQFLTAPGGCEVDFYISYEFKNVMLQLLVGSMFDMAFRKFTQAFEDRAHVIYGRKA